MLPTDESAGGDKRVIFTITVFSHDGTHSTTWGFYFDRTDAEHAIETNYSDISENDYFRYALLQSQEEGTLAIPDQLQWYKFIWASNGDGYSFERAEKIVMPKIFEGVYFPI